MKHTILLACFAFVLTACGATAATPTEAPAAPPTSVPDLPTEEAPTETPAALLPAPTATSAGPLAAQVYVANCTSAPTEEKPGNVLLQISVEATGGNGVYSYLHRDVLEPDKFIDILWERGSLLIGKVGVTSGDGQTFDVEYIVDLKTLECP